MVVVVGHFIFVFLAAPNLVATLIASAPYDAGVVPTPLERFYSVFNLAAIGVAVFFLISGFVIPLSLDSGSALSFLIKRAMRIFPVYWASLGLGIVAIFLSAAYWSRPVLYGVSDYLANVFLVTDFFGRVDIPSVMWTLMVEIKFYLLAPLFHWLIRHRMLWALPAWGALVLLLYWLAVASCVDDVPACWGRRGPISRVSWEPMMIGYMLIGSSLYAHYRGFMSGLATGASCVAIFLLFAVSWPLSVFAMHGTSYVLAYFWAVLIFCGSYLFRNKIVIVQPLKFLAAISYPLYVAHPLVGYGLMRWLDALGASYPVALVVALAAVVCSAWIIHLLVEAPAMRLGAKWAKKAAGLTPVRWNAEKEIAGPHSR